MIRVSRTRVEQHLQKKQQQLEVRAGDWADFEIIGRCLRYLDDPRAQAYFQQAAQHHPLFADAPNSHLLRANLRRLAGETEQAQQHYQQAYELLLPLDFTDKENSAKLDRLALASYMLGNYALTIEVVAHTRPMYRKSVWLSTFALAGLAEAQQTGNLAFAQEMVQTTEDVIRKGRHQLWSEGSFFSPWDTYEEARRVVRALGGDPDAPEEATA